MKYFKITLFLLVVSSKIQSQVVNQQYYKVVSEYFKNPDNVIYPFLERNQKTKDKRKWNRYYRKNFVKDSIWQYAISPIIISSCELYYPNVHDSTYAKILLDILNTTQCDSIFNWYEKIQSLESNPQSEFVAFFSYPRGQSLVVDMFHEKDPNCKFSYSTLLAKYVRYLFLFDEKFNIIYVNTTSLIQ